MEDEADSGWSLTLERCCVETTTSNLQGKKPATASSSHATGDTPISPPSPRRRVLVSVYDQLTEERARLIGMRPSSSPSPLLLESDVKGAPRASMSLVLTTESGKLKGSIGLLPRLEAARRGDRRHPASCILVMPRARPPQPRRKPSQRLHVPRDFVVQPIFSLALQNSYEARPRKRVMDTKASAAELQTARRRHLANLCL